MTVVPKRTFPFSNFQPAEITHKGITYMSVENFYQAMKTEDMEIRQQIANMQPGKAKRFTRTIAVRDNWEDIKEDVMRAALRVKFKKGTYWANRLIETRYPSLVEDNYWHDNFWGSCVCERCGNRGENRLGKMLTEIKRELERKEG